MHNDALKGLFAFLVIPYYFFFHINETDSDECSISPCKNNGTCDNTIGSYNCNCTIGWKIQICNTDN